MYMYGHMLITGAGRRKQWPNRWARQWRRRGGMRLWSCPRSLSTVVPPSCLGRCCLKTWESQADVSVLFKYLVLSFNAPIRNVTWRWVTSTPEIPFLGMFHFVCNNDRPSHNSPLKPSKVFSDWLDPVESRGTLKALCRSYTEEEKWGNKMPADLDLCAVTPTSTSRSRSIHINLYT